MGFFSFLNKKTISKDELKLYTMQAQRCLEIYDDSQRLFQETVNPDVFFMRYELAIEQVEKLQHIITTTNNAIKYQGEDLDTKRNLLEKSKNQMYRSFIVKYYTHSKDKANKLKTEKGRINNLLNSKEKILEQEKYLSEDHIDYIEKLWS